MASPFSVFRKNQKIMVAGVGIIAMVAFVFVGPWADSMAPRREDPEVVNWKYGTLHESDIYRMQQWNNVLNQFLEGALEPVTQGRLPLRFFMQPFPTDEESVVRMMLLAKKAEKLGMQVSDEAINAYIKRVTMDRASKAHLGQVVSSLRVDQDRRVTEGQLFDAFRVPLLAQSYSDLMARGLSGDPPGARWDYYVKLNRPVTAQVLGVEVADYLDQVEEPSDKELKAFYDEHKDRVDQPEPVQDVQLASPRPGFKRPFRAKFQYYRAEKEALTKQILEEDKFTDEEIEKYYEANKYKFVELPPAKAAVTPSPDKPAEETAAPNTSGAESPPEKPAAPDEPSEPDPAPTTSVPETESAPPSDKPADKAAPVSETAPDDNENVGAGSPTADEKLLALADPVLLAQAEDTSSGAGDASAAQTESAEQTDGVDTPPQVTDGPADEGKPTETVNPAASSDSDRPAGETSAARPAGEGTSRPTGEGTSRPAGQGTAGLAGPPKAEPKHKPLAEVRDEIKKDLAALRVNDRINAAFEKIQSEISAYNDRLVRWELEIETDPNAPKPKEPDFQALAKTYGLEFIRETPFMSAAEAAANPEFPSDPNFMQAAFNEQAPTYRPIRSTDIQDNHYLVWKTEQQESVTPPLEDIRDQVVRAWKLQQAQPLALEAARSKADEVRQKNATLRDLFGEQVLEVGPFTAATMGNIPSGMGRQEPRLTKLPDLDNAGPEFMDLVANLQKGQVGAAMNHPRTVAYVVQVTAEISDPVVLRSEFAARTATNYQSFATVGMPEKQDAYQTWIEHLEREADLHWLRPPRAADL